MLDLDTIIFIKENLTGLHYLVGITSFFLGISPLFLDREKVQKQANVYYIEISAAVFLLFTISMITLGLISSKAIFKEGNCVQIKNEYIEEIPFNELLKYHHGENLIKSISSNHYLLYNYNSKIYKSLDTPEDYKYNQVKCYR